jgi:hypothetical protein
MDTSTGTPSAGAAGVGMLALAPPVQAKIVYTPADVNFLRYPPVTLDLNHDGIGDFVLAFGGRADSAGVSSYAFVYAPRSSPANRVVATAKEDYEPAVALRAGSRIGSGRLFGNADILAEHLSHFGRGSSSTNGSDQWANGEKGLKIGYLGLKFMISGKVHFGWARVTITTSAKTFTATLTATPSTRSRISQSSKSAIVSSCREAKQVFHQKSAQQPDTSLSPSSASLFEMALNLFPRNNLSYPLQ